MGVAEVLLTHVGVDFRGADAGMPQQFLNDPKVRPMLEQMGGEAMAKHVRGHGTFNPATPHPLLDSQPERDGSKGRPAPG